LLAEAMREIITTRLKTAACIAALSTFVIQNMIKEWIYTFGLITSPFEVA